MKQLNQLIKQLNYGSELQLEKWTTNVDKSLVAEVKSTYKYYVQYCRDIDVKFKKLLGMKEATKTEVLQPIYQQNKKTTGKIKCPKCDF